MTHAKNAARFVAAIALVVGFAFAVPPASATEDDGEVTPDASTTQTIPPCANTPEASAGPATAGLNDFCRPWVEVDTDEVDCDVKEDRPSYDVSCEPAADGASAADPGPQVCIPYYHEGETGPVSYTFTGCDVEVSVQTDLRPGEDPTERCEVTATEDPAPVLVECQLSTTATEPACYHIYWKTEVGPVTWEQRSSCDGDISVDEDWRPDATLDTTNCLQIYWKVELGPVVWERSGCSSQIYLNEDWSPQDELP